MIPLPSTSLLIALAILLASNAATGWAWLHARDQVAALQVERNAAVNTAGMCSKSVSDMQTRAAAAAKAARPVVAAAAAVALVHEQRADQILAAPPSTPSNDCQSARDRVRAWLTMRQAASAPAATP